MLATREENIMATQLTQNTGEKLPVAFGRGRQSLEQSVWYSGSLLTFLVTGEDTQGQFALMEQIARKGNVPPPSMTLPPPTETPYSEKQKMMSLASKYGFEFVLPKPKG